MQKVKKKVTYSVIELIEKQKAKIKAIESFRVAAAKLDADTKKSLSEIKKDCE